MNLGARRYSNGNRFKSPAQRQRFGHGINDALGRIADGAVPDGTKIPYNTAGNSVFSKFFRRSILFKNLNNKKICSTLLTDWRWQAYVRRAHL